MIETYVIYNSEVELSDGGHPIDGGSGRIDRGWDEAHKDGSTMSERIPKILAKDPDRKVIYLPDQNVPEAEKHKIKGNKIVELMEEDKLPAQKQLYEQKIQEKLREIAIKELEKE